MKTYQKILLAFVVLLVVAGAYYYPKLERVNKVMHFFDKDIIVENFRTTNQTITIKEVKASAPAPFPKRDAAFPLPSSFSYAGLTMDVSSFLDSTYTTGFLILQNDTIVHEEYLRGHTAGTPQIVWSVSKSFLSALFGIALAEGDITSIEQTVDEYCPELSGSGYEGVRIKDVLQMSSGVAFNEDYGDFWSDINRWGRGFAWGTSQDDFAASLVREKAPGTFNHYVSINTHVLGMVLVKATGKGVTEYAQEKLWTPLGMEHDSYWLTDDTGMEMALGGLNTTVRNCARLGSLYEHKGNWRGKQVVTAEWVTASVTPDAPHLQPGERTNSSHSLGYGYQWWVPAGDEGEFLAIGVYNQFIYVNPTTHTVIVKHSANPYYTTGSPLATTEMFLALCRETVKAIRTK
ncbi:serine hydrolase [Neolewinella aurantiaca]|uniref:Serine hydrolase n=1 Tax=Neolewinella aurantiaca TaxID=2602767 RepID=A0A5C7F5H5_9BACT|nr:serine hydrolase [Neolewinella aurantiaca]TXF85951.1 serine hydrolase [Neolewinella aurantiaca]